MRPRLTPYVRPVSSQSHTPSHIVCGACVPSITHPSHIVCEASILSTTQPSHIVCEACILSTTQPSHIVCEACILSTTQPSHIVCEACILSTTQPSHIVCEACVLSNTHPVSSVRSVFHQSHTPSHLLCVPLLGHCLIQYGSDTFTCRFHESFVTYESFNLMYERTYVDVCWNNSLK